MVKKGFVLGIYAVGHTKSGAEVATKDFLFIDGRVKPQAAKTCRNPTDCFVTVLGNGVIEYVTANPNLWNGNITDAIDAIMEHAKSVSPRDVGPPYAILQVDANGAYWINQTSCAAIKTFRDPVESKPKTQTKAKKAK